MAPAGQAQAQGHRPIGDTFRARRPLNLDAPVDEVKTQLGIIGVGQEITVSGQPSDYTFTYHSNNREKNVPAIVIDETPDPTSLGSPVPPPLSGAPAGTPQSVVTTVIEGATTKPTYPPVAVLVPSTTAVRGGGITRGLLVTSSPVTAHASAASPTGAMTAPAARTSSNAPPMAPKAQRPSATASTKEPPGSHSAGKTPSATSAAPTPGPTGSTAVGLRSLR